jgi:DNA-binding MarR family transcriptional regulator
MDQSKELREQTRKIECNLQKLNCPGMCGERITLTQCHALVEIGRMESTSLKDLAQRLTLDTSTVSKTVENLVRKNLISRKQLTGNRRMVAIQLTPEGMDAYNRIEEDMNLRFEKIRARIPGDHMEMVLKALDIYNRALEE